MDFLLLGTKSKLTLLVLVEADKTYSCTELYLDRCDCYLQIGLQK